MSRDYDIEDFDRIRDWIAENMESDTLRGDLEHGFWIITADDLVITNVREDYHIYASARGIGDHHTGKEIGDGFGTVEEVIEQLRDLASDSL